MSAAWEVGPVEAKDPAVQVLVEALTDELAPFYTDEQTFGVPADELATSGVELFGAFDGARLVAIGGLGVDEHGAEVKRFYVVPDRRGSGAADAVLDAVVERARGLGHDVVRLETGDQQHAAMRFYERRGFAPIERFGPYVSSATSRCYALEL